MWNGGYANSPYTGNDYGYQQQSSYQAPSQGPPVTNEEPLDWELIKSIDPALLKNNPDLGPLQKFISDFIVADFETCPSRLLVHPLLIRMCQITQFALLYMSDVQKQYIRKIEGLQKDYKAQNDKMKKLYLSYKKADELLKKKSQDFERCPICRKKYKNIDYLDQHFVKHHPVYNNAWLEIRSLKPQAPPQPVQPQQPQIPIQQTPEFKQLMQLYTDLKEEIRVERQNNEIEKEKLQQKLIEEREKMQNELKVQNENKVQKEIPQKKKNKQLFETLSSAVDDLSQSWIAWEENSIIAPSPQKPKQNEFLSRRPPTPIPDNIPQVSSPRSPSRIINKSRDHQNVGIPSNSEITVRKSSRVTISNKPIPANENKFKPKSDTNQHITKSDTNQNDPRRKFQNDSSDDESESVSYSVKGIFSRNSKKEIPKAYPAPTPSEFATESFESSIVKEMRKKIQQKAEEQKEKDTPKSPKKQQNQINSQKKEEQNQNLNPFNSQKKEEQLVNKKQMNTQNKDEKKPPSIIVDDRNNKGNEKKEEEKPPAIIVGDKTSTPPDNQKKDIFALTPIPDEMQQNIQNVRNLYVPNKPKFGRASRMSKPFSRNDVDDSSSSSPPKNQQQKPLNPFSETPRPTNISPKKNQEEEKQNTPTKKQENNSPSPSSPKRKQNSPVKKPQQEEITENNSSPNMKPTENNSPKKKSPEEIIPKEQNISPKKKQPEEIIPKEQNISPKKKSPEKMTKEDSKLMKKNSSSVMIPEEVPSFCTDKSDSEVLDQDDEMISFKYDLKQSPPRQPQKPPPVLNDTLVEEKKPVEIYMDGNKQQIEEEEEEEDWPFELENSNPSKPSKPIQISEPMQKEKVQPKEEEKEEIHEEKIKDKKNDTLLGDESDNSEESEVTIEELISRAKEIIDKNEEEVKEEQIQATSRSIQRTIQLKSSVFLENDEQKEEIRNLLRIEISSDVEEYDNLIGALRNEIENEFPFENKDTPNEEKVEEKKPINEEEKVQENIIEKPEKKKKGINEEEFRKPVKVKEIPKPFVPPNNFTRPPDTNYQPQKPSTSQEPPKPKEPEKPTISVPKQNSYQQQPTVSTPKQNNNQQQPTISTPKQNEAQKPPVTSSGQKETVSKPGILNMEIPKQGLDALLKNDDQKIESNVFEFETDEDTAGDDIAVSRKQVFEPVKENKEEEKQVNEDDDEYYYIYEEEAPEPETKIEKVKISEYSPPKQREIIDEDDEKPQLTKVEINDDKKTPELDLEYEYVYEEEEEPEVPPPPPQKATKKLVPTFYEEPEFEDGELTFSLTDHKKPDLNTSSSNKKKGLMSSGNWD
ncbi:hypothetical protein TVAG_114540 [Trichomonas vaginalis G3]|uniref:Uncharacterized protein n=1 Tax=Trichomonas vaginalis (strain ATCC PRA-98 / G3) TaxID=412133 RepID=A2FAS3_TRIV3|nr:zinc finger, C2H2-type family protein [Trichomonas vaginalis G3]EAX98002.1 hypothetical protein TVAG_114540 [Trichomonas vaginalis G3]KAI5521891.1 zinc finger, C2H2-type family protein [Trichomonas vaginalis G3]|eukprot:XP_001310932.1 hypothetical protein [Trichomonas vaginalis G3]